MLYVTPVELSSLSPAGSQEAAALRREQALRELDRLLAYTMLQEMRKTVPENKLLGSSSADRTFQEMLDDALAGEMAKTGQLGVAKQVEDQLRTADNL